MAVSSHLKHLAYICRASVVGLAQQLPKLLPLLPYLRDLRDKNLEHSDTRRSCCGGW